MEKVAKVIQKDARNRVMNILIVDDRPENLLTLESILENENRNIIKASGGNEALRLAIKQDIGLILLDIQMPDIDGVEVAGLLRSNNKTRHIPIVFVSAVSKSERPVMTQFEIGTVDCLYKPLDLEETKTKVAFFERMFHLDLEKRKWEEHAALISQQLEQFIYLVSHDLKAPLRAIENLTNWIFDDLSSSLDTNTNENILLLRSRVNRMGALLEGILEFSRSGRLKEDVTQLDLNQLVHGIYESLEAPSELIFSTELLPVVKAEPSRMYKIFYNLIKNAIVHHPAPEKATIKIKAENLEDGTVFHVSDNGSGIKPQYHEQVFELFCTLKSRDEKETVGVGLAIVKKLIEDAGGKIWIEGNEEQGTTFKFLLPVLG